MSITESRLAMRRLLPAAVLGTLCIPSAVNADPVDEVNPNLGGIGHLLVATAPIVQLPHGMVELAANPFPETADRYLADKLSSFSIRALPRYATAAAPSWIMATTGALAVTAETRASSYDHDAETVTPYYSSVLLEDYNIEAEFTATEHAAYFRYVFPSSPSAHILLGSNARVEPVGDRAFEGVEILSGANADPDFAHPDLNGARAYFYAEFSRPFASSGTWSGAAIARGSTGASGPSVGFFADYATSAGEPIEVRIGVSYIDLAQARRNLAREIPAWDFAGAKNRARRVWSDALGRIKITGGTERQRTIFYSALYRVLLGSQAMDVTEDGRYYSLVDGRVHAAEGHDFYRVGSNWGSHHSLFPLLLVLEPERQNDLLRSYVRMEEEGGWLSTSGGQRQMIGRHEVATITDAYLKGFRDFDAERAYAAMKRNAMETTMLSRHLGASCALTELDRVYLDKGFFPALAPGEKETVPQVGFGRQSVSVTLENCYDDWCLAQLAGALGKEADRAYFSKRAVNYRNLFDARIGFMRPKTADGRWVEPYDPIWSGGQGGRDYFTENNGWNYTWFVPHDVQGLCILMGGREPFVGKLNAMFRTTVPLYDKFRFLAQFPDMTGWIGMYSHGNEPTWHIPYLYNYAGAPWMTQRRVREIMDVWYGAGPLGMCGDEDFGEMSSWYVLSAMGVYTVCPGRPVYDIGSPIFERAEIDVGRGRTFTIEARDVSARNKYIQSAVLNGEALGRPWFTHSDLANGGGLVLAMGPRPNPAWGSAPGAAPPSLTPVASEEAPGR